MGKVSTARKIGIAGQVAFRQIAGGRTTGALLSGVRVAGAHFGRVLRQLWLEVTGFFFLMLALVGGAGMFREYQKYQAGESSGVGRMVVAGCFTASFLWFGLSSFWRVKRRDSGPKTS